MHHFEIMRFYREKYKNHVYFLDYDKLVNAPETQIRKLLDWLGVSWNEDYLNPHESKQGFFTASNIQVRAPINNKSVGGWQNYSKLLQEPLNFFKMNNFKLNSFEKLS